MRPDRARPRLLAVGRWTRGCLWRMEDNGTTTLIGRRVIDRVPFGVRPDDRFRHLHIIGQTGTGKSHLLKQLFLQDAHAGNGCAFIDPHGVEAVELLDYIPPHRMRDVVYFNGADRKHPLGFNLLENVPPDDRDRVAQEVVGTFRYLWADTWGRGRMQYIFRNTVAALLDFPKRSSLLASARTIVSATSTSSGRPAPENHTSSNSSSYKTRTPATAAPLSTRMVSRPLNSSTTSRRPLAAQPKH